MRDYDIRRVFLRDEAEQIIGLQADAPEFTRHYPKHKEWLAAALSEVVSGDRVAFGIFTIGFDDRQRATVTLFGSIILKTTPYSHTVEIKNLFISSPLRRKGHGSRLYQRVEEYCAKVGFTEVKTEVPCAELETVAFLHRMGFRVTDAVPSPYRSDEYMYRMHKSLPTYYRGDCFDSYEMVIWLLTAFYGFSGVRRSMNPAVVEFRLSADTTFYEKNPTAALELSGLALVTDDTPGNEEIEHVATSPGELKLAFLRQPGAELESRLAARGIRPVDLLDVQKELASRIAYKPAAFNRNEIAGMIVTINPEYFKRIDGKSTFTYFKAGPVGKFLRPNANLLFFAEPTAQHPQGGLKGLGFVAEVYNGKPDEVWQRFEGEGPIFVSEEEYLRYAKNKREVLGIRVRDFTAFEGVDYRDLVDHVLRERVDMTELGHLYIDKTVLERLESMKPALKKAESYDVALSFAGEDRAIANEVARALEAAGVSVFYDMDEKAALWGVDLYQHLQKVYRDLSRFSIVFVSAAYVRNRWTKHELQQIQARAFRENREYILPIRLDETELPGLNETVAYLSMTETNMAEIVTLVRKKLAAIGTAQKETRR